MNTAPLSKKYHQGKYSPSNKDKCLLPDKCYYRSSWEYKMMVMLDKSPNVKKWASEPFAIKYVLPTDNKIHRYYPDFYVEMTNGKKYIIEIKPENQKKKPKTKTKNGRSRNKKTLLKEQLAYIKNQAKWKYAQAFCKQHGYIFEIITENNFIF